MNALKTGIHAKSLVLPSEKVADLQQLIDEFYQHHHPASPEARVLLDDLIRCEWTLRRLGVAETQLFEYAHQEAVREEDEFPPRSTSSSCSAAAWDRGRVASGRASPPAPCWSMSPAASSSA